MKLTSRTRLAATAAAAAVVVGLAALPADAAVHLESRCDGSPPCYFNYDTKRLPGATGTMQLGLLIRMSRNLRSYCPASYKGRNNFTSKREYVDNVKIVWTDTRGVQYTTTTSSWGASWASKAKPEQSLTAPWYNWTTQKCSLWLPVGQSSKHYKKGNGAYFYGHNGASNWTEVIDLD